MRDLGGQVELILGGQVELFFIPAEFQGSYGGNCKTSQQNKKNRRSTKHLPERASGGIFLGDVYVVPGDVL